MFGFSIKTGEKPMEHIGVISLLSCYVFLEARNEKLIKLSLKSIHITVKPIGCHRIEYNTMQKEIMRVVRRKKQLCTSLYCYLSWCHGNSY